VNSSRDKVVTTVSQVIAVLSLRAYRLGKSGLRTGVALCEIRETSSQRMHAIFDTD